MNQWQRDEHARILFGRMLGRFPVWVNSPVGQITRIESIALDEGEIIAFDSDGQDRLVEDYLLTDPERYLVASGDGLSRTALADAGDQGTTLPIGPESP